MTSSVVDEGGDGAFKEALDSSLGKSTPSLSPAPTIRERPGSSPTASNDPRPTDPVTPRRPSFVTRGLSLQLQTSSSKDGAVSPSTIPNLSPRAPLSPKPDSSTGYGSPTSLLPRRSRGMDFSRSSTNLHHSMLAEQSSPESSPILSGKPMNIPSRANFSNPWNSQDSPSATQHTFSASRSAPDNHGLSSSIGSVNMLGSGCSSSSSDEDDDFMQGDESSDPITTTPHVYKLGSAETPTNGRDRDGGPATSGASPGGDWMGTYSPAARTLMSFQRARFSKRRSRKSSSSASASGGSSMASPSTTSPPLQKSIESATGYFSRETSAKVATSRRSSLSWTTRDLRLSPSLECEDGNAIIISKEEAASAPPSTPVSDEKRGVVKRAVTRRGNLLPKSKNFARIKAALIEEHAPVDSEVKREAEVVRQVRDNESELEPCARQNSGDSASITMPSPRDSSVSHDFTAQAQRNSEGNDFWDRFASDHRVTPPPPLFTQVTSNSSILMDESAIESPSVSTRVGSASHSAPQLSSRSSRASTPQPPQLPTLSEITKKMASKRRREDDFDDLSLKRRAVSPGLSVQNSPVLAQSPASKDGWWGLPVLPGNTSGERANSSGSTNSSTAKRVGYSGMRDANDGIFKMSID